jgi:hypothetical protein
MQNSNHVFAELAGWFVHGPEEGQPEIVLPTALNRPSLDFSIASLQVVDAYLGRIRDSAPENLATGRWLSTVLRAGAYVGEVFARESPKVLNWLEYNDLVTLHPEAREWLGNKQKLSNNAALTTADFKFMTAPHGKVCKFIWDGPEDSVWYYVGVFLDKLRKTDAE